MLRILGYTRVVPLDSFYKPNFKFVADILLWLCNKLEPKNEISPSINFEAERVMFMKNSLSLISSKTRIDINALNLYYSDYRAINELFNIISLLYKGYE